MDWKVPTITEDARCACGYNLRGLTYDHACPECGRDVLDSARLYLRMPSAVTREGRDDYVRLHQALADAADASGFSTRACWLVNCAVTYASIRRGERGAPVTAGEVCRALREYARLSSGGIGAAVRRLQEFNISSSEDVGKIVYALVGAGVITESPTDSREQFNGLFTLESFGTARLS